MLRIGLALAFCGAVAGCATTPNDTARAQNCVAEIEETTGSRVESNPVCPPAEGN